MINFINTSNQLFFHLFFLGKITKFFSFVTPRCQGDTLEELLRTSLGGTYILFLFLLGTKNSGDP